MQIWMSSLVIIGLCAMGCSQQAPAPSTTQPSGTPKGQVASAGDHDHDHKDGDHDHEKEGKSAGKKTHEHTGWWCAEHGVPEKECSQCFPKVAADFQKKGDWCAEHDRAKSQCFICDPSLKEKFAAQYRAKEGKDPPPLEEKTEGKDEHDHEHKKDS